MTTELEKISNDTEDAQHRREPEATRNKRKEKQLEYRAANREFFREKAKAYYANNREVLLRKQAEYRSNNREKVREQDRARYARNRERILQRAAELRGPPNRKNLRSSNTKPRSASESRKKKDMIVRSATPLVQNPTSKKNILKLGNTFEIRRNQRTRSPERTQRCEAPNEVRHRRVKLFESLEITNLFSVWNFLKN